MHRLIVFGACCCCWLAASGQALESVFGAYNLELEFPSPQERQRVLSEGLYDPGSVIPIDVDVYYKREDSFLLLTKQV